MGLGKKEADTCLCDPEFGGDQETLTLQTADYLNVDCESKEETDEEDDEEGEEDDEEEEEGVDIEDISVKGRPFHLPSCLQSRPCVVCLYLFLILVLLSSLVALFVIGLLVAVPYHKASSFELSSCQPIQGFLDREERRCSCGKGCNSKYPCLKLTVRYVDSDHKHYVALLSQDESTLHRQCSFYPPCRSSRSENLESVRLYAHQFGQPHHNYTCYHNPRDKTEVIQKKRFQLHHVVHGMLWSSLTFIGSFGFLIFTIRRRGCEFL